MRRAAQRWRDVPTTRPCHAPGAPLALPLSRPASPPLKGGLPQRDITSKSLAEAFEDFSRAGGVTVSDNPLYGSQGPTPMVSAEQVPWGAYSPEGRDGYSQSWGLNRQRDEHTNPSALGTARHSKASAHHAWPNMQQAGADTAPRLNAHRTLTGCAPWAARLTSMLRAQLPLH